MTFQLLYKFGITNLNMTEFYASCCKLLSDVIKDFGEYSCEYSKLHQFSSLERSSKIDWYKSKVGKNCGIVNEDINVRNSYYAEVEPRFNLTEPVKNTINCVLSKIHPTFLINAIIDENMSVDEKFNIYAPYMLPSNKTQKELKKIYHDSWEVLETPEKKFQLLCYIKDCFFSEHVDTNNCNKFATTLIFIPSVLEGGDLILDIDFNNVYDPDSVMCHKDGKVILKVSELRVPTLITFHVDIPHSVDKVVSGERYCLKTGQYIPKCINYFNNETPHDGEYINTILTTIVEAKIEMEIRAKMKIVEEAKIELEKVSKLRQVFSEDGIIEEAEQFRRLPNFIDASSSSSDEDSGYWCQDFSQKKFSFGNVYDDPGNILETLKMSTINQLVVLKTGPTAKNVKYIIDDSIHDMKMLTYTEIKTFVNILRRYPFSTIRTVHGRRKICSFSQCCSDTDIKNKCVNPGKGDIILQGYDSINVIFLGNPRKHVFGFRNGITYRYNDSSYSAYENVVMYAICVQKVFCPSKN